MPQEAPPVFRDNTALQGPIPFADVTNAPRTTAVRGKRLAGCHSVPVHLESPVVMIMTTAVDVPSVKIATLGQRCSTPPKNEDTPTRNKEREMGSGGDTRGAECAVTPEKNVRPRRFLKKYLFLKNLHALPCTPEQTKKSRTAPPFLRPVGVQLFAECDVAATPNEDKKNLEDVHSCPSEKSDGCVPVPVEALPRNEKDSSCTGKKLSDTITIGRNGRRMCPEVGMEIKSSTGGPETPRELPQSLAMKFLPENVEPSCTMETERGVGRTLDFTEANKETIEGTEFALRSAAVEDSGSKTNSQDISPISVIGKEDVIVEFGGCELRPPFFTPPDGFLDSANPLQADMVFEKDDSQVTNKSELMDFHKIFLEAHLHKTEEIHLSGPQPISGPMVSAEETFSRSSGDCNLDVDHFFSNFYEKQFNAYKAKLLDIAFDVLYVQMVAIPMTEWLEFYERRLICMGRDLVIRSMIEVFVLTVSRVYGKQGRGKRASSSTRGGGRVLLLSSKAEPPPSQTFLGHSVSVTGPSNDDAATKKVNHNDWLCAREEPRRRRLPVIEESRAVAVIRSARASSDTRSTSSSLSSFMVVNPVPRKRTPKRNSQRSIKDANFFDIVGFLKPNRSN